MIVYVRSDFIPQRILHFKASLVSEPRTNRPEILEALPEQDWNPNSIHLILNNMIKKGVVEVEGVARCGRGYGRTYAPTISRTEYAAAQTMDTTSDMSGGERLLGVFAALVDKQGIDEKTIAELEQMLEQKRKELDAQ